jgi:hypothetical protein
MNNYASRLRLIAIVLAASIVVARGFCATPSGVYEDRMQFGSAEIVCEIDFRKDGTGVLGGRTIDRDPGPFNASVEHPQRRFKWRSPWFSRDVFITWGNSEEERLFFKIEGDDLISQERLTTILPNRRFSKKRGSPD